MTFKCYIIEYGINKKKLTNSILVEDDIRQLFKLGGNITINLQLLDTDLGEFLDATFEEINDLTLEKDVIKLKIITGVSPDVLMIDKDNEHNLNLIDNIDQNMETVSVQGVQSEAPRTPTTPTTKFFKHYHFKETSSNYILPKVLSHTALGRALEYKEALRGKNMSSFMNSIYIPFMEKKQYYIQDTGYTYEDIAKAILLAFPHLGRGLEMDSALELWKSCIMDRFANGRRRDVKGLCTKRALPKKCEKVLLSQKSGAMYGVPNYRPPLKDDEEDEFSLGQHILSLKQLYTHATTVDDRIAVGLKMAITFTSRRHYIFPMTENAPCVYEILETYPCLKIESEFMKEVDRLFEYDHLPLFVQRVATFVSAVEKATDLSKSKHKAQLDNLFGISNAEGKESQRYCALLLRICLYLKVDPSLVIGTTKNTKGYPKIVIENNVARLDVENNKVFLITNLRNTLYFYITSFYVFNIAVPKALLNLIDFLAEAILNIKKPMKKNNRLVLSLHEMYEPVVEALYLELQADNRLNQQSMNVQYISGSIGSEKKD